MKTAALFLVLIGVGCGPSDEVERISQPLQQCWARPNGTTVCQNRPENLPYGMTHCDGVVDPEPSGKVTFRTIPATLPDASDPAGWCLRWDTRIACMHSLGGADGRIAWAQNDTFKLLKVYSNSGYNWPTPGTEASAPAGARKNFITMSTGPGVSSLRVSPENCP